MSDQLNLVPDGITIHARLQERKYMVFRRLVLISPPAERLTPGPVDYQIESAFLGIVIPP